MRFVKQNGGNALRLWLGEEPQQILTYHKRSGRVSGLRDGVIEAVETVLELAAHYEVLVVLVLVVLVLVLVVLVVVVLVLVVVLLLVLVQQNSSRAPLKRARSCPSIKCQMTTQGIITTTATHQKNPHYPQATNKGLLCAIYARNLSSCHHPPELQAHDF